MKRMYRYCLIPVALLLLACSRGSEEPASASASTGSGDERMMPAFELTDIEGNVVRSDDLRGKVVLVNFWATWCGPCISEIPMLNEVYRTYRDRGFELLGVASQSGDAATIARFAERVGIEYPVLIGTNEVVSQYRIFAFPTDFLIDRDGRIRERIVGAPPGKKERLTGLLDDLL
jgi:peroxiredoxin